jgi:hypothetical protein
MVHLSMPRFVGILCYDPFSEHIHTTTYDPLTGAVFYRKLTQVAVTNDGDTHASTAMSLA